MINILIADDEGYIRDGIVYVLKMRGYNVFESSDGIECLDIIRKENVDLIILDLKMPLKNGWQTAKDVREIKGYENTPVLVYSGHLYNKEDLDDQELSSYVTEIIAKPLDINTLIKLIEKYTGTP